MKINEILATHQWLNSHENKNNSTGFAELVKNFMQEINKNLEESNQAVGKLLSGNTQHIEQIIFAIEKADLSLKLLIELRNRAIESYKEIMRMQV